MNSTVLPSFQFGINCQGFAAARLTWPAYVDGRKLENSCLKISHYCCIDMSMFRAVWLLDNLTLDGKLCLRDDKNAAFVLTSPSLAMAGEPGKHHDVRAH